MIFNWTNGTSGRRVRNNPGFPVWVWATRGGGTVPFAGLVCFSNENATTPRFSNEGGVTPGFSNENAIKPRFLDESAVSC